MAQHVARRRNSGGGGGCGCVVVFLLVFAVSLVLACALTPLGQTLGSALGSTLEHLGLASVAQSVREVLPFPGQADDATQGVQQQGVQQQTQSPDSPTAAQDGQASANLYVYNNLSAADQQKYTIMLDAFTSREQREFPYESMQDVSRIREYVIADHPELFYVSGVSVTTTTSSMLVFSNTRHYIEGSYRYGADESRALRRQLDERAASCLAGMPDGADDYEKAKYLYEYIAENVSYDWDAYDSVVYSEEEGVGQTAVDALLNGSAVCAGYAAAFQYLAQSAGLPCIYVTGTARGDTHAWNVVQLDGAFYHVDSTWGDPQFVRDDGALSDSERINYDYLNVTTSDILRDHRLDANAVVPPCEATRDNYYVREGLLLDDASGQDAVDAAGAIIEEAFAQGQAHVQFRCATQGVYDALVQALFAEAQVYRFLPGNSCWYSTSDVTWSITVIF